MCGLAGLYRTGEEVTPADAEVVRAMCDTIRHRGPDDDGVEASGRCVLGSRRLAIIDLSSLGHMPMSDASGRWRVAYNGELYNYETLRDELVAIGYRFRSRTDTEVVLYAFIEWGADCLTRLYGIFAFAIYDREDDALTLVRDHYGIKPLYYTIDQDRVLFSSEIKTLVSEVRDARLDRGSLAEWMLYRNIDAPSRETLIEDIQSVLPGERVRFRGSSCERSWFYKPSRAVDARTFRRREESRPEEVVARVDEVLTKVIEQQLMADVPVGTLLSGGLDSCLVTAMSAVHRPDLKTFHVSIAGFPRYDERRHAEHLSEHLGLEFIPLSLDGALFRRRLAEVAWLSDMPLTHPNSVAYHLISEKARQHGVIVLQSGEGADELFGGYFMDYRRKKRLMALEPWLDRFPEVVRQTLALLVYAQAGLPVTSHRFRDLLPPAVAMLDRYRRAEWLDECERAYSFVDDPRDRAVLGSMLADLSDFLAPLLRRLDRTSMGASVECRVPFLDPRMVHEAINLPLDYKVGKHANKWVLKQVALRYMPRELVFRKKMGFPLPLDDFLGPLATPRFFADGFCERELGLARYGIERQLATWPRGIHGTFGLIALEMWGRLYVQGHTVGQLQDAIAALEAPASAVTSAGRRKAVSPERDCVEA